MDCPACGAEAVDFSIPASFAEFAPREAVAICPRCLTMTPIEAAEAPAADRVDFTRIIESFPAGEAGAGMALAVGLLVDSLVLNRDAIEALFEAVSDAGHDPWLVLERLSVAGSVQPDADLRKARHQLEQLWD